MRYCGVAFMRRSAKSLASFARPGRVWDPPPHGLGCFASSDSIDDPAGDLAVAVDAAVAQERPVAADVFDYASVNFTDQNFFVVVRGFGDDATERIAEK